MDETQLLPELQGLQLQYPDVTNPDVNSKSNENGLSDWQRFVVKNFFDTQPARRRAYLSRLNYEMGKDGESYRPKGSDAAFQPIEEDNTPFIGNPGLSGYLQAGGSAELLKDVKDLGFDFLVEAPTVAATMAAGSAVGAASGTAAGGGSKVAKGAGTLAGAGVGAALGKAEAETIKKGIGDFFLDEEVPMDLQEAAYQSMTTGVLSMAGLKGGEMLQAWKKVQAENVQKALREVAVRKSNGTWNDELAKDFAKNPEKYTPENVKGATKRLMEFADHIFGTSSENPKSTRQLKGGVAKAAISPLNERADLEIQKLSKLPEANFSVEEIYGALRDRVAKLRGKKFPTQDEENALKFIGKELEDLKAKTKRPGVVLGPDGQGVPDAQGGSYQELSFQEGRDFLKRLQNAAFEEGPVKGNATMAQMTNGLKELADAKAGALGSDLPTINMKRSEILRTYKNMQSMIKDGSIQSAYVGKDSVAKQRVQAMFDEADRVLDTDLAGGAQSLQFQSAVERVYESPSAFGSGSVFGDAMREGLKKGRGDALKGFAAGQVLGYPFGKGMEFGVKGGALLGAKGFVEGAKEGATFARPETLVKSFSKIGARIDELNRNPTLARDLLNKTMNPLNLAATQVSQVTPVLNGQGPLAPPAETAAAPADAAAAPELLPELQGLKLAFPPGFEDQKDQGAAAP